MKTDQPLRTKLLAVATVCAGLIGTTTAVTAESFDGSTARVSLASELRMLTQKIGSASCRVNAGIGAEQALEELTEARQDFNTIMTGLENGSLALGIPSAEKSRVVLKSLKAVQTAWKPINDASETLISNAAGKARAHDVIASDTSRLLEATVILTSDMAGRYSNPHELTQADAMALNIAGRQPM
ncbi:MAG: type IV pili methyl-accepting chemotaxis transducer N-terminal domain-containing protein, partial [Pseudomonadota bacterium]